MCRVRRTRRVVTARLDGRRGRGRAGWHRPLRRPPGRLLRQRSAESIIGLFKTEVVRRSLPWPSVEDVAFATLEQLLWLNDHHLLGPIGDIPDADYAEHPCTGLEPQEEKSRPDSTPEVSREPGAIQHLV
jgi:hypothetical protein